MKKWLQHIVPIGQRQQIRYFQRLLSDVTNGSYSSFATKRDASTWNASEIRVEQFMNNSALADNKRKNIQIAVDKMNGLVIYPGTVFSFWHLVRKVSKQKGYLKGRNLRDGKIVESYGGGLCQLAGIVYHTMLLGGLKIMERHAHSVDIYKENERYTPLGADAAVLYGYKDLRIKNSLEHPVQLNFSITTSRLTCILNGIGLIEHEIDFLRKEAENRIELTTKRKSLEGHWEVINQASYQRLNQV